MVADVGFPGGFGLSKAEEAEVEGGGGGGERIVDEPHWFRNCRRERKRFGKGNENLGIW